MNGPARALRVLTLRAPPARADAPCFVEADILPDRGMMLLQARLRLPNGRIVPVIEAPDAEAAARRLDHGPDDFAGNASFAFGGAVLVPYANRIRGRALPDRREIETEVDGHVVRLPRNWGGKAPGAEQYAMHGLILDRRFEATQPGEAEAHGRLDAGDFDGRWPGRLGIEIAWSLNAGALHLQVGIENTGSESSPVGVGWHPYLRVPSGDRAQARLWVPAATRVLVDNYDEVLPTGAVQPVAGTPYDFGDDAGRPLGQLYLDDCFTDLERSDGVVSAILRDPASGLGLRLSTRSPDVSAFQVYAPIDRALAAIEPQFNLADPFGAEWRGRDTGMRRLRPGDRTAYDVSLSAFMLS